MARPTPETVSELLRLEFTTVGQVTLDRLSGGASRETWAIDTELDGSSRRLIMQLAREGGAASIPMRVEAAILRATAASGVPVAGLVLFRDSPESPLGTPVTVVERLRGETLGKKILREHESEEDRGRLLDQVANALVKIHRTPLESIDGLRPSDPVRELSALLEAMGQPSPAFEAALVWLAAHPPSVREEVLVHGDFRLGNLLVDGSGLVAALDWELSHRGDPIEDLGWLCVRAWRFGGAEPVAGIASRQTLLDAYRAAGGIDVAEHDLRWWEVLGTLKWGLICMLQARAHLSGATRSVELAAIGRRVAENEYDLTRLLLRLDDSQTAPIPLEPVPEPTHHESWAGRPTAVELVEAVAEFLETTVKPATEGRVAFHAKVAANALALVRRELLLGGTIRFRQSERLTALGYASLDALGSAIRSGAISVDDELVSMLLAEAIDQLELSDPGHLLPIDRVNDLGV